MRGLKTLVIVLGVVMVGLFGAVVYTIGTRLAQPPVAARPNGGEAAPAPSVADSYRPWGLVALREPEGTRVHAVTPAGGLLVVHLYTGNPGTDERLVLVDPANGGVVGRIAVTGGR